MTGRRRLPIAPVVGLNGLPNLHEQVCLLTETGGWADATGIDVQMPSRTECDPELDRMSNTREWLRAITSMRNARTQLQKALSNNESREQVHELEFVYENALTQSETLTYRRRELGTNVGNGHPRT